MNLKHFSRFEIESGVFQKCLNEFTKSDIFTIFKGILRYSSYISSNNGWAPPLIMIIKFFIGGNGAKCLFQNLPLKELKDR